MTNKIIEIPEFNGGGLEPTMDFQKLIEETFVDIETEEELPPIAISIGTHDYKGRIYPTPFGSYGDFSCIVGASKSKKTFLKSLLVASYIGGNASIYAPSIKGHDSKDKVILEIDTEQSKYHCRRVFMRVAELVGCPIDLHKPFSLRGLSVKERVQFTEYLFRESEYRNDIGLATIDGIADLVSNVNDEEQSYHIAQKLLEWSENSKSHIITILHKNFQANKPTGHLGSAVLKKAETVLFIEREDDSVIVKPEYTRNIPIDDFKFGVNKDWLPYIIDENATFTSHKQTYPQPTTKDEKPPF